jgi:hypothetical protein
MRKMAERGTITFLENLRENTQLIEFILNKLQFTTHELSHLIINLIQKNSSHVT